MKKVQFLPAKTDMTLPVSFADAAGGIVVANGRNGDFLAFAAVETSASSTLFLTTEIPTDSAPAAVAGGILQVVDGDTLSVSYTDEEDATDDAATAVLNISGVVPVTLSRMSME